MINIEIIELLSSINLLIEYFVPGYIFLFIFCRLMNFEDIKTTNYFFGSVVVSYFLKNSMEIICYLIVPKVVFKSEVRGLILIFLSIVLSILLARLMKIRFVQKLWHIVFNKGLHNSLLADNVGTSATTVKILCNNRQTTYIGQIAYYEDKGIDSWIVLKKCIIIEDGKRQTESYPDIISTLAVNMKNIDRIIFYQSE